MRPGRAAISQKLRQEWAALEAVAGDLLRRSGDTGRPSLAEYRWAHSIFWRGSRSPPRPLASS